LQSDDAGRDAASNLVNVSSGIGRAGITRVFAVFPGAFSGWFCFDPVWTRRGARVVIARFFCDAAGNGIPAQFIPDTFVDVLKI
jgi:hypothetical protein